MKQEILAPAGGKQQLIAAVRCGADAVYLGTKGFNARRNAENFESETLADSVRFCHSHGVKVHVAVNTLVMDDEMSRLEETACEVAQSGADAVIVQDLAVMELFLKRYPSLPVHASTQCVVHNTDGVRFYEDMGVKRVVLARELSLKEIEKIRRETTVELEAFIHGALCMSISGGCYLSSVIGGRSGNRGLCAQPCRLDFKCAGKDYALSLKDMSHIRHIQALKEAGVTSFKIEGRMKRPEYVAAAVTACRKALKGEAYDEQQLRAVFSRSGFTDGYLTGKRGANMFGHREKEDVVAAEGVLNQLQRLYDKEQPLLPIKMRLEIQSENPSTLTVYYKDLNIQVNGQPGIIAERHPTDAAHAMKFLNKTGGTPFFVSELVVKNDDKLMLPPSEMNAMRRQALDQLVQMLETCAPHLEQPFTFDFTPHVPRETAALWARFTSPEQLWENDVFEKIILPLKCVLEDPALIEKYAQRLIVEPPAVVFTEHEDAVRKDLEKAARLGVKYVWAENAYAIQVGRRLGLEIYGGASLNITNTWALEKYESLGLEAATVSFELQMGKIARMGGKIARGYIAYGHLPVMRMRNCPRQAAKGCGQCRGEDYLTDRTGAKFLLMCDEKRSVTLLNSVPLHLGGKKQSSVDFKLLYFTTETAKTCKRVAEEILLNQETDLSRTGGLYYRALK